MKTFSLPSITSLSAKAEGVLSAAAARAWSALSFDIDNDYIAPRKCVCVSIEHGRRWSVSVVYGSRFLSRLRIKGFRRYEFETNAPPSPGEVSAAVLQAVGELHAGGADVTLSLPKSWTVIQTAEFPAAAKGHLPDVIFYELDRLTPFTPDGAYYDFRILKEEKGKILVLLAAVKAKLLAPYLEAFELKSIPVKRATFHLSGIAELLKYETPCPDCILLDINHAGYEGAVIRDGSLSEIFGEQLKGESSAALIDKTASRLNPIIDQLKAENRLPGVICLFPEFDIGPLGPKISAPVKELGRMPFKSLLKPGNPAGFPLLALGGLFESLRPGLSLKATDLLCRGKRAPVKKPFLLSALLFAVIAGLGIYYLIFPLQIEEKRVQDIDSRIKARKEEVRKVEQLKRDIELMEQEVRMIDDFKTKGSMTLTLIKELTLIMPKDAWLERIKITEANVDIEGYADSASQLLSRLEASDHFGKAEFASAIVKNARMNSDRFSIKMEIKGVKKLEAIKQNHAAQFPKKK